MIRILNFNDYIWENFSYEYSTLEGKSSSDTIVFIGGIVKYMSTERQTKVLEKGLPSGFTVISFGYINFANIKSYVEKNPGSIIICFSRGCQEAPNLISIEGVKPDKIYMIEPYHGNNANIQLGKLGIPEKNFFVGPNAARGKGIVSNPSNSNGRDHFDALTTSARQIFSSRTSKNTTSELISESSKSLLPKNIIIGDSQSRWVDWGSEKFKRISDSGSENALWLGGMGLKWLNNAVIKHSGSTEVKNIAICIGTNGGFNPSDGISGLVTNIENKFPNAKLFAVQGSWNWGGNLNIKEEKVKNYYSIFSTNKVEVIEPAIGPIEPHGPLPIYKIIGKNLDNKVQ